MIVPSLEQRRAPGWAHGYPYTIGDVHLISPRNQHELDDALQALGDLPVYQLALDADVYDATGDRRFTLKQLK